MKYVYTYGVFDLFHAGHVDLLKDVRKLGDFVTVGLFTDKVATSFKREPIIPFEQRKKLLEAMGVKVMEQKELSPIKNIKQIYKDEDLADYPLSKSLVVAKGPGANYENEFMKISEETGVLCVLLPYH